jgi:hypothetical protein
VWRRWNYSIPCGHYGVTACAIELERQTVTTGRTRRTDLDFGCGLGAT